MFLSGWNRFRWKRPFFDKVSVPFTVKPGKEKLHFRPMKIFFSARTILFLAPKQVYRLFKTYRIVGVLNARFAFFLFGPSGNVAVTRKINWHGLIVSYRNFVHYTFIFFIMLISRVEYPGRRKPPERFGRN